MNKEQSTSSSYPLDSIDVTAQKNPVMGLNDTDPEVRMASLFGTPDQQLVDSHRISHPYVSEQMTMTDGQPNRDPHGGLRWSRNEIVRNAKDRHVGTDLSYRDVDAINTKLRTDAEEIHLSLDAISAIDEQLSDIEVEQQVADRRRQKVLAAKVLKLVNNKGYLERRAEWLSGHSDYKEKGELFSAEEVVKTHDIITRRMLKKPQADGSRPLDKLYEQAINQARADGVEINIVNE